MWCTCLIASRSKPRCSWNVSHRFSEHKSGSWIGLWQCPTSSFDDCCWLWIVLERLVWCWKDGGRKMAEQINWRAKQPSQKLACRKMWSVEELERLLIYKHRVVDSTLLMTWGREREGEKGGACQRILKGPGRVIVSQDQHWNCLRGKVGQTRFWNWETWWTTYGLSWVLKYHLELK